MQWNWRERNGRPLLQFDSLVILDLQKSHRPLIILFTRDPMSYDVKTIRAIKLWWWVLTEIGVAYVFGNLIARLRLREMAKLLIQHSLELKKHHLDLDLLVIFIVTQHHNILIFVSILSLVVNDMVYHHDHSSRHHIYAELRFNLFRDHFHFKGIIESLFRKHKQKHVQTLFIVPHQ